jgi:hypothetical protein
VTTAAAVSLTEPVSHFARALGCGGFGSGPVSGFSLRSGSATT